MSRCPNSNSGDSVMSFDPMANGKRRSRNSVIYEEWQLGQAVEKEAVHVVVTKEFVLALLLSSENHSILKGKNSMSEPSCHDGSAWLCTNALCACICRHQQGTIIALEA